MPVTGDRAAPAIHHIGYVVDELRTGVEQFAAATGAGPFFAMEHIHFDEVTYEGRPAIYDHSSAFGAWGALLVELTHVHDAQPAGLRDSLTRPGAGVGHVAWLADDLEAETARLTAAGLRPFHTGRAGPAAAVWFHGDCTFGHPVEVLARRDEILRFYEMVRAAGAGWNGDEPLRVMTGPPQ
ncbi:MAG TPA: VOC family protein [Solirubrobacteraceae bacterium]